MPLMFSPEDLEQMKALKRGFDPKWLLNGGKVFPLTETGIPAGQVDRPGAALMSRVGGDSRAQRDCSSRPRSPPGLRRRLSAHPRRWPGSSGRRRNRWRSPGEVKAGSAFRSRAGRSPPAACRASPTSSRRNSSWRARRNGCRCSKRRWLNRSDPAVLAAALRG